MDPEVPQRGSYFLQQPKGVLNSCRFSAPSPAQVAFLGSFEVTFCKMFYKFHAEQGELTLQMQCFQSVCCMLELTLKQFPL